tara:strand:- start:1257 stop:1607 length:351 start_codon:yes stop_codon:yes gene_type:complete
LTGLASNKKSTSVPDDCFLDSIELELSSVASSDTVTIFLARDSAGKVPVTIEAADATQTVTMSAAAGSTTGGVSYTIGKDYHFDTTVSNTTSGTLYLVAKASAATTVENVHLNWRS